VPLSTDMGDAKCDLVLCRQLVSTDQAELAGLLSSFACPRCNLRRLEQVPMAQSS
jgi:hypothetical protein